MRTAATRSEPTSVSSSRLYYQSEYCSGVRTCANYATVYVGAELGPADRGLGLDWATDAGDATDEFEFSVSAADPQDAYLGLQAFDVAEYGHEIEVNGVSLSGFDVPPAEGWQYWVDTITNVELCEGTNTLRIRRDTSTRDSFAVGTVTIHWKEPLD